MSADISHEELQLATRNHGMPLEALRYPITPAGLHYLLIHYDVPDADADAWVLEVGGRVQRPLTLRMEELRQRPAVTATVTMECAGNGRSAFHPRPVSQPWVLEAVGTARWTGTPLVAVLEEAGIEDDAVEIVFEGADVGMEGDHAQAYARSLTLEEARRDDLLLVYEMNGAPLPPQHGFPLRLLVPGWYGMASVKWLRRITVVAEPFVGYQNAVAYRMRQSADDPGDPVTRIEPRAVMIPPGIPSFPHRSRYLPLGPCDLTGRAWSGWGAITSVEVSADGGASWRNATLDEPEAPDAWQGWRHVWDPPGAGDYELCCRATDANGRTQPMTPQWNLGGYLNNAVQRVAVTVRPT